MANDESLEGIVIFGGSLDELNSIGEEKFKVAGTFFHTNSQSTTFLEEAKKKLKEAGYDGLIRANLAVAYVSTYYLSGVPVKKRITNSSPLKGLKKIF